MALADVPTFVDEIVAAGCDIFAVGDTYIIAVDDLTEPARSVVEPKVAAITDRYGKRDHLVASIAHYLAATGRLRR